MEIAGNLGKLVAILVLGLLAILVMLSLFEQLGASAPSIILTCVLVPLALYVTIGVVARNRDPVAFDLAGRSVPALWNGMAAAAGWLSASSFFGLAGVLFVLGYDGFAYGLGWIGGFAIATVLIAPYLRKSGAHTVADFFGARFGAPARLLAVFALILSSFTLLVAELSLSGGIFSRILGIGFEWTIFCGLIAIVASTILGGMRAVTWSQVAQYLILIVAYLVPLILLSAKKHGFALPQLAYGQTLAEITGLETSMLEKGLADAKTFKPHAKPFLQLDALNFFALSLCLMAGTASLPHILARYLTAPSAREARYSGAWSMFFIFLLLFTAPAYAAFMKLEVYALIERGTELTALPAWIETASRLDLVRIHGVSLKMLEDVIAAARSGATDIAGVAAYAKAEGLDALSGWLDLKEPVKAALLDAARSASHVTAQETWEAFQKTVLAAAAHAGGNKTGLLTHGALAFDPSAVVISMPEIAGAPRVIAGLVAAGAVGAAIATANGLLLTIATALGHDVYFKLLDPAAAPERRLLASRAALLVIAILAAHATVALRPADPFAVAVISFSLAAAGIFPALVLGIWWKRANGWGAVAGMVVGLGLALYYIAGTRYFAVDFYETWSHLSNASEGAERKFASLKSAWDSAQGDSKVAAWTALETQARGTSPRVGIANWFGIHNGAAALFGLPAGFLVIFLVSLITPRPSLEKRALVEEMRRPRDAMGPPGSFRP
jgi:cation/acetate symporter